MADDERATVRTLTEYRIIFTEKVEAHEGRIVDTTGDSVMATFESVVEAVEAAVEVQRDLAERNEVLSGHRKMHFRIGINLGDIIVREDGTIYGDGVNVAARLESIAESGGIMIADFARQAVEGKLGVGLEDSGEHEVKNIAKPVRAWRVLLDGSEAAPSAQARPASLALRRPKVIAGLATALAVIVGLAVWGVTVRVEVPQMVMADGTPTDDPVLAMPTGPAIAVLPFKNLSGDPEQDYFADGIAEDILTKLSRFDGMVVISRTSTFQFKNQDLDVREIAEKVGAKYILEGSVRRAEEDIRITAQLIDGRDGSQIWAKSYDETMEVIRLFELQDEIVNSIAAEIAGAYGVVFDRELTGVLSKAPNELQSYDCTLLALRFSRNPNPATHLAARDCLEGVTEMEPDYADAWASLSDIYMNELFGHNPRPDSDPIEDANHAARKALELSPANQVALTAR